MITLSLVTGFLGSGKTTFMRRVAAQHRGRRLVFLVNECSPLDVDGPLLENATDGVVSLPGGSIFCTCLVTEFINTLRGIPERFGADMPVEGVIIEASGIANPKVIERMLRETQLDEMYALSTIISIVDPGTFRALLESLPNIAAQIEAADTVILNKTDAFDEKTLESVEEKILHLNPGVRLVRATYCDVELDILAVPQYRELDGEYAPCADPDYAQLTAKVTAPLDAAKMSAALAEMKPVIYRIKGFVPGASGNLYLDYSASGLTFEPADVTQPSHELAIIASGSHYDQAQRFAESLRSGQYNA